MTKYAKKYARDLGMYHLRKDGRSIEEVCQGWGISPRTYYRWVDNHKEFAEAAEVGEMDAKAWWHRLNRDVSSGIVKGNAGTIKFAMANVCGWKDKSETKTEEITTVKSITINVLEPKQLPQMTNNVIELIPEKEEEDV